MKPADLLSELQTLFAKHANPQRAKEQQRYMKSKMPYWGLGLPEVRKLCKPLFKKYPPQDNGAYRKILLHIFKNAKKREEWYAGENYAKQFPEFITEENVDLYIKIVRLTQWWDLVDGVAAQLVGPALQGKKSLKANLKKWIADKNMWVRRTALLTQLKYKEKTDPELLAELILNVADEKEFFIRKAIGWALREYSYTNPAWVKAFIKKHEEQLSNLSIREGLKAINRKG